MENENLNRIVPPANEYFCRIIVLQDDTGNVLPFHVLNVDFKWNRNDIFHTVKFIADRKGKVIANLNHEWLDMHFYVTNLKGDPINKVTYEFVGGVEYEMINLVDELGEVRNSFRW